MAKVKPMNTKKDAPIVRPARDLRKKTAKPSRSIVRAIVRK